MTEGMTLQCELSRAMAARTTLLCRICFHRQSIFIVEMLPESGKASLLHNVESAVMHLRHSLPSEGCAMLEPARHTDMSPRASSGGGVKPAGRNTAF